MTKWSSDMSRDKAKKCTRNTRGGVCEFENEKVPTYLQVRLVTDEIF